MTDLLFAPQRAAHESKTAIEAALQGTDMVFVTVSPLSPNFLVASCLMRVLKVLHMFSTYYADIMPPPRPVHTCKCPSPFAKFEICHIQVVA